MKSFRGQTGRILDIQFVDLERGIALGERGFYVTQDGGNCWLPPVFKKTCSDLKYLCDNYEASPAFVEMLDAKLWWIGYDDGRIVRTTDRGQNWCDLVEPRNFVFDPSAARKFFLMVHFENANDGWGLGWDRFLYETKDGGASWVKFNSEIKFFSVAFLSNGHARLMSEMGIYRF